MRSEENIPQRFPQTHRALEGVVIDGVSWRGYGGPQAAGNGDLDVNGLEARYCPFKAKVGIMKKHWTTCIVGFVTLLLIVFVALSRANFAQDAPAKQKTNEFEGKVVTAYLADPLKGAGQILTDAELVEIGGRWMLVGIGADTGRDGDWTTGMRIGIAWNEVQIYYAMTEEQFGERLKKHGRSADSSDHK